MQIDQQTCQTLPRSVLSPRLEGLWERVEFARRQLEEAEASMIADSEVWLARQEPSMQGHPLLLAQESCEMQYEQVTREFFYQLRQEVPATYSEPIMNNTLSMESALVLDGRIFAMLTPAELELFKFYRDQGRKYGVVATIVSAADPAELAKAKSQAHKDEIMRRVNSTVSVVRS